MPTLVGNKGRNSKTSGGPRSAAAAAAAEALAPPVMSSPPRNNTNHTNVTSGAAYTLSVGGVHFCLQPASDVGASASSDGEVSLKKQGGHIVLSLSSFTGSLVVSQEGNLDALQALAAATTTTTPTSTQASTVEEEPHSPDLSNNKTAGGSGGQQGGNHSNAAPDNKANKVSPGQQTLPFAVKKTKTTAGGGSSKKQSSIAVMFPTMTPSKKADPGVVATPITKNTTTDRKRPNSDDDEENPKKNRRGFFPLPTKTQKQPKKADENEQDVVMEEEEKGGGTVEDVPVFQSSQTQSTQCDEGEVEDIDVSQTMDSGSSYTTNNSSIPTDRTATVADKNGSGDDNESVATAHGDEADGVLDEADGMIATTKADEDTSAAKTTLEEAETSVSASADDDVDMTSTAGYPAPPARWGHTVTKIQDDKILVYGGQSFDLEGNPIILSDVHIYSPSKRTWEKPINCRGESRQWHTATYIPERQMIIAFGGETEETTFSNNKKGPTTKVKTSETLRVLDTDIMLWYPPAVSGDIPSGRSGHSATYIPQTNELLLFGGVRASKWLNVVSILDCRTWIWTTPKVEGSPPKPRSYHSATLVGSKVVVFGGNNNRQSFNTVHVLEMVQSEDDCTWRWSNPTLTGQAPFPRTGHTATLLQDGKTICVYGGWDPNTDGDGADGENIFKGSYLLDTQTWTWKEGPKVVPGGSGSPHHHLEDCGPKRCGADAVLNGDEVLVFGGRLECEVLAGDIQRLPSP
mmetsp:Transcript_17429/g.42347  ORF Transcript_17429/g.42347 Transcript_17429/m.42347 type:complete len:745 (-) Transcript_17429:47-2281(-)